MPGFNIALILICAAAVLVFAQLYYLMLTDKKIRRNFKLIQERYGFSVDYSKKKGFIHYPAAEGTMRSYPIKLGTIIDSGSKGPPITFVSASCNNPAGLIFDICARGRGNNIRPGTERHPTGDSEFDEKLIVSSNNPEIMYRLLNFSIKHKLIQITNVDPKGIIKLDNNMLIYSEHGSIIDRRDLLRIELMLHLLCEIADMLTSSETL